MRSKITHFKWLESYFILLIIGFGLISLQSKAQNFSAYGAIGTRTLDRPVWIPHGSYPEKPLFDLEAGFNVGALFGVSRNFSVGPFLEFPQSVAIYYPEGSDLRPTQLDDYGSQGNYFNTGLNLRFNNMTDRRLQIYWNGSCSYYGLKFSEFKENFDGAGNLISATLVQERKFNGVMVSGSVGLLVKVNRSLLLNIFEIGISGVQIDEFFNSNKAFFLQGGLVYTNMRRKK
jgi:hypothetical protein